MKTAEEIGRHALAVLEAKRILTRAQAQELRGRIRTIDRAHPGPVHLSAKAILRTLATDWRDRERLPSLRTVQNHLREVRRESAQGGRLALAAETSQDERDRFVA